MASTIPATVRCPLCRQACKLREDGRLPAHFKSTRGLFKSTRVDSEGFGVAPERVIRQQRCSMSLVQHSSAVKAIRGHVGAEMLPNANRAEDDRRLIEEALACCPESNRGLALQAWARLEADRINLVDRLGAHLEDVHGALRPADLRLYGLAGKVAASPAGRDTKQDTKVATKADTKKSTSRVGKQ